MVVGHVRQTHFDALDSLRGLCACLVALFHFKTFGNVTNSQFIRESWLFVDFFFVLSGFVIYAGYGERLRQGYSTARFMALRMGRIYPLHFAMLAVFAAFEVMKLALGNSELAGIAPFTSPRSPGELAQSLALVQIFGFSDWLVWNGPSWSIAAEMWTYLITAVLLAVTGKRSDLAIALLGAGALVWLATTGDGSLNRTYSGSLIRCLYGFSLGVLAYRLLTMRAAERAAPSLAAGTVLELAVIAGTVAYAALRPSPVLTLAAPVLFVVAVYVFALESGRVSRTLKHRVFLLVGKLSYSIYMIHAFVEARLIDVALVLAGKTGLPLATRLEEGGELTKMLGTPDNPLLADLLTAGGLVAIVALSWVSYRLIEAPFRKLSRRWFGADTPGRGAGPQTVLSESSR